MISDDKSAIILFLFLWMWCYFFPPAAFMIFFSFCFCNSSMICLGAGDVCGGGGYIYRYHLLGILWAPWILVSAIHFGKSSATISSNISSALVSFLLRFQLLVCSSIWYCPKALGCHGVFTFHFPSLRVFVQVMSMDLSSSSWILFWAVSVDS